MVKFDIICLILASLPKKEAQNIHFITCSNRLSVLNLSVPIVEDLLEFEKGVMMFDASLNSEVLVISNLICAPCDNVRAAELLNHLGSKATKLCRICMVYL